MTQAANDIDKNELYGRYQRQEDASNKLAMKMRYKALDIPEDDMGDIQANKTITTGFGWKELVALGGLGLGGAYMFNNQETVVQPQPTPVVAPAVPDSEYEVRFYDKDGNLITVPRMPQ